VNISAYLGVSGLLDVGYRFYTTTETAVAARVTTGITDGGDGWYSAEVTIPATTASVRWDSTGTAEAKAREYFVGEQVWAKTMTEATGAPAVTASVLAALQWVFLLSRNKITQTATTQTLRNDADSANLSTSTVSDDGSQFTRGKFS
jgi:hypothetical protein